MRLEELTRDAVGRVRNAVVTVSALKFAPGGGAPAMSVRSIGTGVIVDPRGYVLTNAHVVREGHTITVTRWRDPPGEVSGEIVDLSEEHDLALIRLDGQGPFPHAVLGRSSEVRVGDMVIAIGSPYGLEHTVTRGIISDRSRTLVIQGRTYKDLLQTDAAINQGNSGGPLIDINGEVIGISTAIYAPDGVSSGVGFAIPADSARAYVRSVLTGGSPGLLAAANGMEPIIVGTPSPHPPGGGKCTNCHELIVPYAVANPGNAISHTVATTIPFDGDPLAPSPLPASPAHKMMSPEQDLKVIKRAAGLVLASSALFNMLGIGGGFVYVPLLLFFGVEFHVASATSLFVIMAAHMSAFFVFLRSRLVDYKLVLVLEPVTCLGSLIGGMSSGLVADEALSVLFGGLLMLSGLLMQRESLVSSSTSALNNSRWTWHRTFDGHQYGINLLVALPFVFVVGYLGGMLGFAGGWLKIPMLVLLFGVPIKVAIGTSSLMVAGTSMLGCIGHGIEGHFDPRLALALAIAGVIGAQVGSRLTLHADHFMLKRIFSVVLVGVALWMIGRVL